MEDYLYYPGKTASKGSKIFRAILRPSPMKSLKKKVINKNPFEKKTKNGFQKKSILEIKKTPEKKRDKYLDYIKGFACLMMLFAHFPQGDFLGLKNFFGSFAPFLFFACTGISSGLALRRKDKFWGLVFLYFVFFLFSLSCNFMRRPGELANFQNPFLNFDFFQIIAIGSIFSLFLHRFRFTLRGALLTFAFILGIHFLNKFFLFSFGQKILFSPGIFTIFPWLAFFVLGFIYSKLKDNFLFFLNLALAIFVIFYFYLCQGDFLLPDFSKWNMNTNYLLLGIASWSFSFSFFRILEKENFNLSFLGTLGKYSMIFVYAHFFIQNLLHSYELYYIDLPDIKTFLWGTVFSVSFTALLALSFDIFNKNFRLRNPLKFFTLAFFLPFLPFLHNELFITVYYFLFGVLFSVKFREISNQIFIFAGNMRKKLAPAKIKI